MKIKIQVTVLNYTYFQNNASLVSWKTDRTKTNRPKDNNSKKQKAIQRSKKRTAQELDGLVVTCILNTNEVSYKTNTCLNYFRLFAELLPIMK